MQFLDDCQSQKHTNKPIQTPKHNYATEWLGSFFWLDENDHFRPDLFELVTFARLWIDWFIS